MYNSNDSYWKIPKCSGPEETFINRGKGHKNIYQLYLCDMCRIAFGHPLTYCPSCPGRMIKVENMTYDDFVKTRSGFEWGESKIWDGRWQQRNQIEAREKKIGKSIPCVFTTWPYVWKKDEDENGEIDYKKLIPRLIKELGVSQFTIYPLKDYQHRVEVSIYFSSFREFLNFFYDEKKNAKFQQYKLEPA